MKANLEATDNGLEGEAFWGLSKSTSSFETCAKENFGINWSFSIEWNLLGIKSRVQQQLIKDFVTWCELNEF